MILMRLLIAILLPPLFSCTHGAAIRDCPVPTREVVQGTDDVTNVVIECLNKSDAKRLFDLFDGNMRVAVPLERTEQVVSGIHSAGKITSAKLKNGGKLSATYILSAERGEWLLSITLDEKGKISRLMVTEPPAPAPAVARNTIPITVPFKGAWTVLWGGDNVEVNHHADHQSQRRAADLVVVGPAGQTFRNDGKDNSDYYAYGQEVLAVADGKIITAIDGVPENTPARMNPYFAPGNAVFIQHAPNLYSVYAHLKPGSLRVRLGVQVKRGQVLGLCGNSGTRASRIYTFSCRMAPCLKLRGVSSRSSKTSA